ncbi:MAG: GNAT family acetyltransferase [Eubacteriales bacterium]|nr:GNAT family acetyltransferase [Eubacteriales bacterium]
MLNGISVVNIREYLQNNDELGEDILKEILSEFSCEKNPDVERFLKEQAIEFTKKNQSVTYIVLSNRNAEVLGYFTLAIKPISLKIDSISKTMARKISRVSEVNEFDGTYSLSAFLIAQLGKNYTDELNKRISGEQLLEAAIATIRELQFRAGGMVTFLEAAPEEKLLHFYRDENRFKLFGSRLAKEGLPEEHRLVQLLRVL